MENNAIFNTLSYKIFYSVAQEYIEKYDAENFENDIDSTDAAVDNVPGGNVPQTNDSTATTPVFSAISAFEPEDYQNEGTNNTTRNIIIALLVLIIGGAIAWFAFFSGNNKNNPLGVQKPKWEKFVKVNTSDVKLYKEADVSSSHIQLALRYLDGVVPDEKMIWSGDKTSREYNVSDYNVEANTVFPVLDESDEWYRVYIGIGTIREAYIQKQYCEEVKPEPITKEVIDKVKTDNWTTHKLVGKGEFANLYLERYLDEIRGGGETVIAGVLIDGCIVVPDESRFRPREKDTIETEIYNANNDSDYQDWWMICPKKYWKASPEVYGGIFDVNALSESDIRKIIMAIRPQNNTASKVYYYFPTVVTDRFIEFEYSFSPAAAVVEEGETNVTDYEVKKEGEQWRLYAKYGERIEDTGLSFYEDLNVHAVKDFDGDGNVDAVVSEIMSGGNDDSIYHPFIVFYDNESGTFKKTKQMDYYDADPVVEDWNNMCTVCQSEGLRKVRYALKDGELTIVEDRMKSVGNVLHTIKMSDLFGDDENADKAIEIDFDNDGENEKLTFHHGVSHAEYYGAKMNLMGVEWSDGRTLEMCIDADIFKILEEKNNGMPDIIADEWLWRWNGSEYDYYGWDGNKLVKH